MGEVTICLDDGLEEQIEERVVQIETDRLAEERPDLDRAEIEEAVRLIVEDE